MVALPLGSVRAAALHRLGRRLTTRLVRLQRPSGVRSPATVTTAAIQPHATADVSHGGTVARIRPPLWNMEERYHTEVQQRRMASSEAGPGTSASSSGMTVSGGNGDAVSNTVVGTSSEAAATTGAGADAATMTSPSILSAAIASAGWGVRRRRPPTAPDCPPATPADVRALADFVSASSRLLVITGRA